MVHPTRRTGRRSPLSRSCVIVRAAASLCQVSPWPERPSYLGGGEGCVRPCCPSSAFNFRALTGYRPGGFVLRCGGLLVPSWQVAVWHAARRRRWLDKAPRRPVSRHVASIRGKGEFRPLFNALGHLRLGHPHRTLLFSANLPLSPTIPSHRNPTPTSPREPPPRGKTQPSTAYIRYGTILRDRHPSSRPRPRPPFHPSILHPPRRHPPSSRPRMSPGRLSPAPDSSHSPMEDLPRYL